MLWKAPGSANEMNRLHPRIDWHCSWHSACEWDEVRNSQCGLVLLDSCSSGIGAQSLTLALPLRRRKPHATHPHSLAPCLSVCPRAGPFRSHLADLSKRRLTFARPKWSSGVPPLPAAVKRRVQCAASIRDPRYGDSPTHTRSNI